MDFHIDHLALRLDIDGLSALYILENLGIEVVMEAFACWRRYHLVH